MTQSPANHPAPLRVPAPLRGALFDLDGTLVDSEQFHFRSTNVVLADFGHQLSLAEFLPFVGWAETPFWEALKERFGVPRSPAELAAQREECFVRSLHGASIEPLPGVAQLLGRLEESSIPCAVASSSTRREIAAVLQAARLAPWIQAVRSGHDDVAEGKPAPAVYLAAAQALGVPASGCLAVEDSATGVASARAAGAYVVAVPCASHPDPALGAAHLRLGSLQELLPHLEEALA